MVGDHFVQQSQVDRAIVRVEAEVVWLTDYVFYPLDHVKTDHSKLDTFVERVQCQ